MHTEKFARKNELHAYEKVQRPRREQNFINITIGLQIAIVWVYVECNNADGSNNVDATGA